MSVSAPPIPPPSPAPTGRVWPANARRLALMDFLFWLICLLSASIILVVAFAIVLMLSLSAREAFQTYGFSFFILPDWDDNPPLGKPAVYGSLCFIWGTLSTSVIAMLLAVPLGIGSAAYLSEIAAPRVRKVASFFVEMLAAIPSVVYGFWGLLVLGPLIFHALKSMGIDYNPSGKGILSAGVILAIMIVPYITAIAYDVCQAVPRSQREGSYALGGTRWQTIWRVVLPYARPGILAGCVLALGRALGETMAVTLLIGGVNEIQYGIDAKGNSIASVLATNYAEASDLKASVLVELALVLVLVSVGMNALARLLLWRMGSTKPLLPWIFGKAKVTAPAATAAAPVVPAAYTDPGSPSWRKLVRVRSWISAETVNMLMTGVLASCVIFTMSLLVIIMSYLLYKGGGALNWAFFTELPEGIGATSGGLRNAIEGSTVLVGTATLFAVPIGLLGAIYLAEYRSTRLGNVIRFVAEMLGGVPSIVVGLFAAALFFLIKTQIKQLTGYRLDFFGWSGVFALAVMMVPIVIRASEEALKLVPQSMREASYALGSSNAQTVLRVTVPAALPAIVTAIFLSIARIAGETAPLLLTAQTTDYDFESLSRKTASLPYFIYRYTGGSEYQQQQGWSAAFLLMVVVLLLNFGIRFAAGKRVVQASQSG